MEVAVDQERIRDVDPLDLLGHELNKSLQSTINSRSVVEQRWVEDLQQYLGQYDETTLDAMKKNKRSQVFLNITRVMVNQSVAQLADLLFPSDDKNYGVNATPNPDIDADMKDQTQATLPDGGKLVDEETGKPVSNADVAARARVIASEKADAMEREITDQLVECDHPGQSRLALHWAGIFGPAIMAGPEAHTVTRHKYTVNESGTDGETVTVDHQSMTVRTPRSRAVAPWDFYPDMSGSTINEAEFIFERSYLTRKQMRALIKTKRKHFIKENVQKVLAESGSSTHKTNSNGAVNMLRRLTSGTDYGTDNRYEVWTYHGPISKDALIDAGVELDPEDPLDEFDGIVVFCGNHILKAVLNPLSTEEWPYSVWNWAVDDFCIFGFGVPWLCRNEQAIVNTSWRMMLDNATKSAGPQVIAKRHGISPADGTDELAPWKVWYADESISDVRTAFNVFTFPSVQAEISNILQLARTFLSETAGLPPQVGQGQGQMPNTLGGQAMLMNSSNTDRRRQVRDWDDRMTKPLITRFYHWNMEYNTKNDIKGDYEVHARGTSALLLREQQAINLMALLDKYAAHPVLQPALKAEATLRKVVQAMHIAPDELVKTKEEMEAEAQAAAGQEPPPDPQIVVEQMRTEQMQMRSEITKEIEGIKGDYAMAEADANRQLRRDLAMLEVEKQDRSLQMEALKLSQTKDISYQKILADLKKSRWRMNLDGSKFKQEMAIKARDGETANYGLE